jgi:hypothetical protein
MEKNNISAIYGKHNCPYITGYSTYTRRRSLNKYTIQADEIGNLLSLIGR